MPVDLLAERLDIAQIRVPFPRRQVLVLLEASQAVLDATLKLRQLELQLERPPWTAGDLGGQPLEQLPDLAE
jgi:hypothetical protein